MAYGNGLYQKYVIKKRDGSEVDPEAIYFVLRLDKDFTARKVTWAYAHEIYDSNPELSEDLKDLLWGIETPSLEMDDD